MRPRTSFPMIALVALATVPCVSHAGIAASRTDNESDRGGDRTVIALTFSAAGGERNALSVTVDNSGATLTDRVAIQPGRNCFRPPDATPRTLRCRFRGVAALPGDEEERIEVRVKAGDRNDAVLVSGGFPGSSATNTTSIVRLVGGDGDDRLQGIGDTGTYLGGPGADTLTGGPGDDLFAQGSVRDGADTIAGGEQADNGRGDEVSYIRRRSGVRADLAGDRDDGVRGERDRILSGIENLTGGIAGDRLTGDGQSNLIFGGAGGDVVTGGAGRDYVSVGGTRGRRDIVRVRDGVTDFVACDSGTQELELDDSDLFSGEARGPGCETFLRSAPFAAVLFSSGGDLLQTVRTDDGAADLPIACAPDGRRERCRGTARLELDGRSLGSTAFVGRDPFDFARITLSEEDRTLLVERGRLEATLVLEIPEAGITRREQVRLTPSP